MCSTCGILPNTTDAFEKYGADGNTTLAVILERLKRTDANPDPSASIRTYACPECHAEFNYLATHEYFVNGSEDSEELTRVIPLPESSSTIKE